MRSVAVKDSKVTDYLNCCGSNENREEWLKFNLTKLRESNLSFTYIPVRHDISCCALNLNFQPVKGRCVVTYYKHSRFDKDLNEGSEGEGRCYTEEISKNQDDHLMELHAHNISPDWFFGTFHWHYVINFAEHDLDLFVDKYLNKSELHKACKDSYYMNVCYAAFHLLKNPDEHSLSFRNGGYISRGGWSYERDKRR